MEIQGLPLHPLVVHAVVILVPLAALGGIAVSLIRWARERYMGLVVVGAFAAAISTLVAQLAGQNFAESFQRPTAAMEHHFNLGDGLLIWTILLFFGTAAVWLAKRLINQDNPQGRIALIAGAVVTVICGVVSLVQVIRIGHSGATAVWG